jgi:5'-3' exoribonuclease 1
MYGLDADLMILGLLSHEPYFFLLREEVVFGKSRGSSKKELDGVEQKTWHLLSLTLFRDYLNAEFSLLKGQVGPPL